MSKRYVVHFVANASLSVEVEVADDADGNAIIEAASEAANFPYFPGGMDGDLGDWMPVSQMFPDKGHDDYEQIG